MSRIGPVGIDVLLVTVGLGGRLRAARVPAW
jgi:hypothetical protein